jgi:hypothetical protein
MASVGPVEGTGYVLSGHRYEETESVWNVVAANRPRRGLRGTRRRSAKVVRTRSKLLAKHETPLNVRGAFDESSGPEHSTPSSSVTRRSSYT